MMDLEKTIKTHLAELETTDRIFERNVFSQLIGAEFLTTEVDLTIGDTLIKIVDPYYFVYQVVEDGWKELYTNRHYTPYFNSGFFKLI